MPRKENIFSPQYFDIIWKDIEFDNIRLERLQEHLKTQSFNLHSKAEIYFLGLYKFEPSAKGNSSGMLIKVSCTTVLSRPGCSKPKFTMAFSTVAMSAVNLR